MVTFHNGNILDSGADIICHQVNCQGKMNSGVAKAIREKWPEVYIKYMESNEIIWDKAHEHGRMIWNHMLGQVQVVFIADKKTMAVINMFAQENYGYDGRRYTSYDAFWSCLGEIKRTINPGLRIAFPARIGCVRGGANWDVILTMIKEVLGEDYNVEIWDYDKG
jgi:O-acetyl-ADP-ribose deacetylase (regulator of RNase III)